MLAMFGIHNRALTGKLIRLLPVLASALAVTLAGDGSVAAAGRADFSGCQNQIDISENIINTVRVMFDAARVHHHGSPGATVELRGLHNLVGRNATQPGRDLRRIL